VGDRFPAAYGPWCHRILPALSWPIQQVGWSYRLETRLRANCVGVRPPFAVRRSPCVGRRARLPLPDGVGQVRHPRGGLRTDRLQGHPARVDALEQADSGAEQHG